MIEPPLNLPKAPRALVYETALGLEGLESMTPCKFIVPTDRIPDGTEFNQDGAVVKTRCLMALIHYSYSCN